MESKMSKLVRGSSQNRQFWQFFGLYLKGPLREFAQTALKCSFSRARFNGAIGLNDTFRRGLARKKNAQCERLFLHIGAH